MGMNIFVISLATLVIQGAAKPVFQFDKLGRCSGFISLKAFDITEHEMLNAKCLPFSWDGRHLVLLAGVTTHCR